MPFSLIPCHMEQSIYSIDIHALAEQGVRVVLADLDNTLARYSERTPSQQLLEWKDALEQSGIRLFVVSNSRKSTRADQFCKAAGIPYIKHAGKPKKKGFLRAMELNDVTPEQAVMVGDQIFTDILGGNRCGIDTILVRPVSNDTIFRVIRHGLEAPMRKLCKDRRSW